MENSAPATRKITLETALIGESEVAASVSGLGTGIPNDKRKGVLEALTTKRKGTGLVPSIVRTIVETYGGRIWEESRRGGSVFRFTLPLIKAHPA
jgi:signal transduction histidine kinase